MSESEVNEIEAIVEAAKAPGTFSILSVLKDRAYPTQDIDIYLDESLAYAAAELDEQIRTIGQAADLAAEDAEQLADALKEQENLSAQRDELIKQIGGKKFVVTITGISEGRRDDMYAEAVKKFPVEYREDKHVITGETTREEIESVERNRHFTNALWQAHITKITDPDGNVQEGITLDEAIELRRSLPIASSGKITQFIEKIRAATAIFMMTAEEDFLAKS